MPADVLSIDDIQENHCVLSAIYPDENTAKDVSKFNNESNFEDK
jgi:hypothetical protein